MVCSYLLWQLSSCKFFAMLARHCDGPRHSCAPHLAHTLCIVYPQTKVTFSHQIPASVRTLCRILSVPPHLIIVSPNWREASCCGLLSAKCDPAAVPCPSRPRCPMDSADGFFLVVSRVAETVENCPKVVLSLVSMETSLCFRD